MRFRLLPLLLLAPIAAGCGSSSKSSSTTSTTSAAPASAPAKTKPKVVPPAGPAPTKLVIKDLVKGTGAPAQPGDTLSVNYVGVLYKGGKQFDTSFGRGPFSFVLQANMVIKGWDQGLVGMRVGGRRQLLIPASLAYGKQGSGSIPANAPLEFVIDLLKVT
jgi:peptidylprolyl isomerase